MHHQGTPMPISSYAPPTVQQPQTRHYYSGQRGAAPRGHLATRPSMVAVQVSNMTQYVPGGQMYPPSPQVVTPNMQFVLPNQPMAYSQCDGLQLQSGRHHNHATTAGAPPPASNYLNPPFGHAQSAIHIMPFFVPQAPIRNSHYQPQGVPTGSTQPPPTAQPQTINQSGGVVAGAGAGGGMGVVPDPGSRNSKKRTNAVPIIDPDTGIDVVEQMQSEENASQSSESSASHTPQPQTTGDTNLHVVAEFAAAIAKVATEEGGGGGGGGGHHEGGGGVANGPHHAHHPHHHPHHPHHHLQEAPPHPQPQPQPQPQLPPPHHQQGKPAEPIKPQPPHHQQPQQQQQQIPAEIMAVKETPVVSAITNSPPVDVHHRPVVIQPPVPLAPLKRQQSPPSSSSSTSSLSSSGAKTPQHQQLLPPTPPVPSQAPEPSKKPPLLPPPQPQHEKKEEKKQQTPPAPPTPLPPVQKDEPPKVVPPKPSSFADALNVKNILGTAPPGSLQVLHTQQPPQQQQQQPEVKQTNGEAPTESPPSSATPAPVSHHHHETAAGKASQRPKGKKNQKKDLNRKGFEKEGSDMDAFKELGAVTNETAPPVAPQQQQTPAAPEEKQQRREASPEKQPLPKEKEASPKPEEKENQEIAVQQEPLEEKPSVANTTTGTGGAQLYVPPSRSRAAAAAAAAAAEASAKQDKHPSPSPTPAEEEVNERYEETETATVNEEDDSGAAPSGAALAAEAAAPPPPAVADQDEADAEALLREEAIVAANNQENAKLNAEPPAANLIETQIIERSAPPPQLQLKHDYKNGQWSPANREGKRMYDRDLLMAIRNDPLSSKKPDINLDCEIFVKDRDVSSNNNNTRRSTYNSSYSNSSLSLGGGGSTFAPNFMRSSPSQRGMPKRNSQQGRPNQMRKGGLHMTNSLKDEVKLRECENAWKPGRFTNAHELSEEQIKTDALYKKVRSILNKLTPQKFDTLVQQFQELDIDSYERLNGVMDLVFEKAVDEPSFSKAYAEMCRILTRLQVPQRPAEPGTEQQMVNFRKLLISRCQTEFEKNKNAELDVEKRMSEIKATKDPEKRKELQLLFEEEERKIRVRSVGLVRFIGELFKLSMLTTNIMNNCVKTLIAKVDEESLECLCKLLMTIGKELEEQTLAEPKFDKVWNGYFERMARLATKRDDSKVSSRVRFMLQDVMELRANKWVPRRDENNPKTIDQIQRDAERETMEKAALLSSIPSRKHDNRDNRDRDDRRRNMRGGGGNMQSEDGWQSVTGKSYRSGSYTIEVAKLQQMKVSTDHENVLGSATQFSWGSGSGGGVKRDSHLKSSGFTDPNSYAVLDQEDRKSKMGMGGRMNKVVPSPSLEKDRALKGIKAVILDNGKNSRSMNNNSSSGGGGRGSTSGPPSRDNSRVRYTGGRPSGSTTAPPPGPNPPPSSTARSAGLVDEAPLSAAPVKVMSDEEVERKSKTLVEEFRLHKNLEETIQSCKEIFPGENINKFLRQALNSFLDQSLVMRTNCANLISLLANSHLIQPQSIVDAFAELFSSAEDLVIDMPQLWKYLAELIAPTISHGVLNFADFKTMSKDVPKQMGLSTVLLELFELLILEKGPAFVRSKWNESKVQLKDFMSEDKAEAFAKNDKISQILSEKGGQAVCTEQSNLSLEEVEKRLHKFLMSENEPVFDQICDWANSILGNRTKDANFIRALTRAVIKASIRNSKLIAPSFQKHEKLIKRFVDTKEELELACLYGIQHLVAHEMLSPQGLLQSIFQALYDDGTISHEAFIKWKDGKEAGKYAAEGRGVAITTLSTFLVSLSEIEEDDDDSS